MSAGVSSDASAPALVAVGEVSVVVSVKPDATQRGQPLPLPGLLTCADLTLFYLTMNVEAISFCSVCDLC